MSANEQPYDTATEAAPGIAASVAVKDRRRPGRPETVHPNLLPLLRAPAAMSAPGKAIMTEQARLDALHQLGLLDTAPSEAFDRITRMASQVFGLPIAAVSLTDADRQWFKSRVGVDHTSIPREKAPCAQVAESAQNLVIPDLLLDDCYRDSLLASSGVRFYAGAPLTTADGFCLGAMCVLGTEPREASDTEMRSLRDLAAMVMSQIELQHAFGRVDPLSGLPNQNQFNEDLEDLAHDNPAGEPQALIVVDVANPEQLSNAVRVMGTAFLDDMIQAAASVLRSIVGSALKLYHIAPTQFAFLTPFGAEPRAYGTQVAKMLVEARRTAQSRFVTAPVVGVAPFALGQAKPRDVLRIANSAVQDAHRTEAKVSVYSSVQDSLHRRRFTLLNEFGSALEKDGQLNLVFQPRVDLGSGLCSGAEALLRWKHPELGAISPGEFIPLVEQTTMAKAMTAWVLEAVLRQLSAWRADGLDLRLSMNVSASNLIEHDLASRVLQGLARYSLGTRHLELELTESAVMEDGGQALAQLETLAQAGIHLAIDDFGTGYSSLSYLQRLPVHVVKIDQSFMHGLAGDARKRSLVATMILLSHNLGYRVVAEGVETKQVLEIIAAAHCDEVQGYFFGRPMPAGDFSAWRREAAWMPGWADLGSAGQRG